MRFKMEICLEPIAKPRIMEQKTKIVCQVHNCAYNDGFCGCMKTEIDIGNFYARSEKDVACKSFISRSW